MGIRGLASSLVTRPRDRGSPRRAQVSIRCIGASSDLGDLAGRRELSTTRRRGTVVVSRRRVPPLDRRFDSRRNARHPMEHPHPQSARGELWAVVLAGGEGRRLLSLMRALYGSAIPKQFASLDGRRSLLQRTLDRVVRLVPAQRIVIVVGRAWADLARDQIVQEFGAATVLAQPRNLETGPGLLLPLAFVRAHDPTARVVVVPADHHVPRPAPLLKGIDAAARAAEIDRDRIFLLGVAAEAAETEYGWIEAGPPPRASATPGVRPVRRFVEKPDADAARELHRRGALWNTFISVGTARAFWDAIGSFRPDHVAAFERFASAVGTDAADEILGELYAKLAPFNFSDVVLQRTPRLAVVPVAESGWSDLGSPRRVFESLAGTPELAAIERRLIGGHSYATVA